MRFKLNTFTSKEVIKVNKNNEITRSYFHDCVGEREIKKQVESGCAVFVGENVKARYIVDGYNILPMRFAYVADNMTLEEIAAKDSEIIKTLEEKGESGHGESSF